MLLHMVHLRPSSITILQSMHRREPATTLSLTLGGFLTLGPSVEQQETQRGLVTHSPQVFPLWMVFTERYLITMVLRQSLPLCYPTGMRRRYCVAWKVSTLQAQEEEGHVLLRAWGPTRFFQRRERKNWNFLPCVARKPFWLNCYDNSLNRKSVCAFLWRVTASGNF